MSRMSPESAHPFRPEGGRFSPNGRGCDAGHVCGLLGRVVKAQGGTKEDVAAAAVKIAAPVKGDGENNVG